MARPGNRTSLVLVVTLLGACEPGPVFSRRFPDTGPLAPEPPPGAVVCGGETCDDGQECCLATGTCVPFGDSRCSVPAVVPRACRSTADCASGEACCIATAMCRSLDDPRCASLPEVPPTFCVRASDCAPDEVCLPRGPWLEPMCAGGVGVCQPVPETCLSSGEVCGCDGRTYASGCEAARAGVRTGPVGGACGEPVWGHAGYLRRCVSDADCLAVGDHLTCDGSIGECVADDPLIPCGLDAQCPEGQACCGLTGVCFDLDRPVLCTDPELPSYLACETNEDCWRYDGTLWLVGRTEQFTFCGGTGCGTPGACMRTPIPGACDAEPAAPVCGCDGVTYPSACAAAAAATRVARSSACGPS